MILFALMFSCLFGSSAPPKQIISAFFVLEQRPMLVNWEKSLMHHDGSAPQHQRPHESPAGLPGMLRGMVRKVSKVFGMAPQTPARLLWPLGSSGFYEVPYKISEGSFSQWMIEHLLVWAMRTIEQGSNIRFREAHHNDTNLLVFVNGEGCLSMVGRHPDAIPQRVSLNVPDCMHHHTVLHEILHALGLYHEHQRHDSSAFIEPSSDAPQQWLPWVAPDPAIPTNVTPYNLASIMHYNLFLRAKNPAFQTVLDTRTPALSSCDWHTLNVLYPGRVAPPPCAPHEHVKACEPLNTCPYGDVLCPYMCGLDCDTGLPRGDIPDKIRGPPQPFCQFLGGRTYPPLPPALQEQIDRLNTAQNYEGF